MDNFTLSLPKIHDCGGDLKKQWYIYFYAKNNVTGESKQFRFKLGINGYKTKRERREAAKTALSCVMSMIEREDWNPFERTCKKELEYVFEPMLPLNMKVVVCPSKSLSFSSMLRG